MHRPRSAHRDYGGSICPLLGRPMPVSRIEVSSPLGPSLPISQVGSFTLLAYPNVSVGRTLAVSSPEERPGMVAEARLLACDSNQSRSFRCLGEKNLTKTKTSC